MKMKATIGVLITIIMLLVGYSAWQYPYMDKFQQCARNPNCIVIGDHPLALTWAEEQELEEIPWGWYERVDSIAIGGETGVRCLCAGYEGSKEQTKFWVHRNGDVFTVIRAPRWYGDTIGRSFKWPALPFSAMDRAD